MKLTNKNKVIIISVSVLIAVGVFVFNRPFAGSEGGVRISRVPLVCVECGHEFHYGPDEFMNAVKQKMIEKNVKSMMLTLDAMVLDCPACHKEAAVRQIKCSDCGAVYARDFRKETPGKCPKCGSVLQE